MNSVGPAPGSVFGIQHLPLQPVQGHDAAWAVTQGAIFDAQYQGAMGHLLHLDTLLLQQKKDISSVLTGVPLPNSYALKAANGEQILFLEEKTLSYQSGCLCQPQRGFTISAVDSAGQEVARFVRRDRACKFVFCCPCADSCLDEIRVESPPGRVVGRVRQSADPVGCNQVGYQLLDADGGAIFRVENLKMVYCCLNGRSLDFSVWPADAGASEEPVARISKQFHANAINRLLVPGADTFTVNLPRDLHQNMKLTLVGVCVLLDFMLFDNIAAQGTPPTQSLYMPHRASGQQAQQNVVVHM